MATRDNKIIHEGSKQCSLNHLSRSDGIFPFILREKPGNYDRQPPSYSLSAAASSAGEVPLCQRSISGRLRDLKLLQLTHLSPEE